MSQLEIGDGGGGGAVNSATYNFFPHDKYDPMLVFRVFSVVPTRHCVPHAW